MLDIGRPADAKRLAEEALAATPESAVLRILLVRCLIAVDEERAALPMVDQLVTESPEWDYLHRLRSVVLIGVDQPVRATKAARRAVALDSGDGWNHYQLAAALNVAAIALPRGSEANEKKKREAREAARRAVALRPEEPAFHRMIGFLHSEPEHREIRERAWRTALELDPEDTTAMTALAGDQAMRSLRSSGLDKMRHALRLDPQRAPNVRQVVAAAFNRALLFPLLLTVPSGIATILLALHAVPDTWWSRAVPIGFSAASFALLAEALLRVRSSLRAMFAKAVKLARRLVGWILVAGSLPILWLATRHPIAMVCLVLVLIPGVWVAAVVAWAGVTWVFRLGQSTVADKPAPRWDAYLDNQLSSPTREQQTPEQKRRRSWRWMVFVGGFVLVRIVAYIVTGTHDNLPPRTSSSHGSTNVHAALFQVGQCVKTFDDRVWMPILVTDCADPHAVFRVASSSAFACPNVAYRSYVTGGAALSPICLAKNLREGMCYLWPGYGSHPVADAPAKMASCTDPRVHLKVEKRVDGHGPPLICPPGQSMEAFPTPAPGVAYCLSDPHP
ncbi:tetratricopeptide repeat protein [Mycobacterium sp. CBMA271]|nr:hypothetical protein [Mycobacteroides sp. CBMA 326]MUM20672.1 tetratricopeptide repeat protein [Mycobacteroides sp. CBMA 271]